MKRELYSLLLLFAFYGQSTPTTTPSSANSTTQSSTTHKNHHNQTEPICSRGRCSCLSLSPYWVDCDDMNFKEVPVISEDLKWEWRLRLRGNAIKEVSKFPKLENLVAISFKYNLISKIQQEAFANLPNLTTLDLSHNKLTSDSLNSEIFRGPYQPKVPDPIGLSKLDLSFNEVSFLPKDFFRHLTNLSRLDLSGNSFHDFSVNTATAISSLRKLQFLNVSRNQLVRLPYHFFAELQELTELDLSGNNFISVPPEVNFAFSLKSLILNDNIFAMITADSFRKSLNSLEVLHLERSKTLSRIDNGAFGNLTSLRELWLNDNPQLSRIFPFAFTDNNNRTIHLQKVHLQNNHLESLSEVALPWKTIPYVNLQGNPWNCDCRVEWLAKDVMPNMQRENYDLTLNVICALPEEVQGHRMTEEKVQQHNFVCRYNFASDGYGIMIVATIVVGTLLLVTGTVIFSYILFRRFKMHEYVGENVKYRRTLNDDEEMITSNFQY